jgi:hypothetical protein
MRREADTSHVESIARNETRTRTKKDESERGHGIVSLCLSTRPPVTILTSNEALRKQGILPPLKQASPSPSPPPSPTFDDILDGLTTTELREFGEDTQDDAAERYIAQRRAQRLTQERLEAQRSRFGTVIPIGRDDYTREVTEASKQDEPGDDGARGTGVVCFLYKDG